MLSTSFRKQFSRTNECYRFFENGTTNERSRSVPGRLFKVEDMGVDKQELIETIENMNAKKVWLSKFVKEAANRSVDRHPS